MNKPVKVIATLLILLVLQACDPVRYITVSNKTDQKAIICYNTPAPIWDADMCDTISSQDQTGLGMGIGFWSKNSKKQLIQSIHHLSFTSGSDSTSIAKEEYTEYVKVRIRGLFNTHLKILIKD